MEVVKNDNNEKDMRSSRHYQSFATFIVYSVNIEVAH